MTSKILNGWTTVLGVFGLSISVQDLTQIINLVLLVLSVLNISIMILFNVYNIIKNKKLSNEEKIEQIKYVVEDGTEQIKEVLDNDKKD